MSQTAIQRDTIRQLLNIIAVLAAFAVNIVANIKPLGGLTLGEISNQLFDDVLITPANYAFAIWGLIYIGLFSFAIYQALPAQRSQPIFRRIGYWLVVAMVAQMVWVFLFQLRFFSWSFLAMLLILSPLMHIYTQLTQEKFSKQQRRFVKIPLTIYFAWISVATIVNAAVSLTALQWKGWGISPEIWTVLMMVVGSAIALIISWRYRDIPFTGVFMWALSAIAIRHLNDPLIAVTGFALTLLLGGVIVFRWCQRSFVSEDSELGDNTE